MYRSFGKRMFDIAFSALGLLAFAPVFLAAALAVKLGSPGPVFFRQKRMGLKGRPFTLIKFRSMTVQGGPKSGFEPGSSVRVTPVGRLLRKTKVDELPQLVNVLAGDMSFVGPRPEVEHYTSFYTGRFAEVLNVRPGITDTASIKYRHEEKLLSSSLSPQTVYQEVILPDKLEIALKYVKGDITLVSDIKIIVRTLASVLER